MIIFSRRALILLARHPDVQSFLADGDDDAHEYGVQRIVERDAIVFLIDARVSRRCALCPAVLLVCS